MKDQRSYHTSWREYYLVVLSLLTVLTFTYVSYTFGLIHNDNNNHPNPSLPPSPSFSHHHHQHPSSTCSSPPIRREWRSLWPSEQQHYITAALCLQSLPSTLRHLGTLYDDFVYIHHYAGSLSHQSAAFLPWHRAYLHIYQSTLADKCNYTSPLPYWDWALDWSSLSTSTIWSDETGFGGAGNTSLPLGPGDGHCVTTGPFANSRRQYFDGEIRPHCLGRTFIEHETNATGSISKDDYTPERIGLMMRSRDYDTFRQMMEGLMHNALHWSVRGDFSSLTAANDPIFWLHHAQLDRLWYLWQSEDPERRDMEYWGTKSNDTDVDWEQPDVWGSDDLLDFKGFWRDEGEGEVRVRDVMSTTGGLLCYRY